LDLQMETDRVHVLRNTTGFNVVHGRLPRPADTVAALARG
jgi:hypothetical protein